MNIDSKQLLASFEPKQSKKQVVAEMQLLQVRYSPCGKFLVGGCYDGTVRRWDATKDDYPELPPLKGHNGWVQCVAFHPDGELLYSADTWGRLSAWKFAEENPEPAWSIADAHDGWIHGLVVSPDGSRLATCGVDRSVRLWSSSDGAKQQDWTGHENDLLCLAFHPQGESLAVGDLLGTVKQWDLASAKSTRQFECKELHLYQRLQDVGGVRSLAFDAKGETLACGGTQPRNGGNVQGQPTIVYFEWATGNRKHLQTFGETNDVFVYEMHFHPAGFVMAVSSGNPGIGKFAYLIPGEEAPFFLHARMPNCNSLAVHPDWNRLAFSTTNARSNGNGRRLKDGEYVHNSSPIFLWDLPGKTA